MMITQAESVRLKAALDALMDEFERRAEAFGITEEILSSLIQAAAARGAKDAYTEAARLVRAILSAP